MSDRWPVARAFAALGRGLADAVGAFFAELLIDGRPRSFMAAVVGTLALIVGSLGVLTLFALAIQLIFRLVDAVAT